MTENKWKLSSYMYQLMYGLLLHSVVANHPLPLSDRLRLVCSAGGRAETDTHISLPASHTAGVICCNRLEPHTCWREAYPRAFEPHMDAQSGHENMLHLHTAQTHAKLQLKDRAWMPNIYAKQMHV